MLLVPFSTVSPTTFTGQLPKRSQNMGANAMTSEDAALSEEWLSRTDQVEAFYGGLRDKFEPGKLLWITETADAACGGNPWASTFRDIFRYLDQLGRLAKHGVQVQPSRACSRSRLPVLILRGNDNSNAR